jgi:hypothetical protein
LMMEFAEIQEIECSEERPPNNTPTLIFSTDVILFVLCCDWLIQECCHYIVSIVSIADNS